MNACIVHWMTPRAGFRRIIHEMTTVWRDIVALFVACGAEISEGNGSRERVALNGVRAVFHRPHPQKETDKGAVKPVRRFLTEVEIRP
jgi:hypothetical protein